MATPMFRAGMAVEDRIVALLSNSDFIVKQDRNLDHQNKIDFAILSFPANLSHDSMGVQVTLHQNREEKIEQFAQVAKLDRNRKFRKLLYLELDPDLDLESEGRHALITLLTNCQLHRSLTDEKMLFARIYGDGSYDLRPFQQPAVASVPLPPPAPEVVVEVKAPASVVPEPEGLRIQTTVMPPSMMARPATVEPPALPPPMRLVRRVEAPVMPGNPVLTAAAVAALRPHVDGAVNTFHREKGFGFITVEGRGDYFFYIGNVTDTDLRDELNDLPMGTHDLWIPVHFMDVGKQRHDVSRPEGKDVRRLKKQE